MENKEAAIWPPRSWFDRSKEQEPTSKYPAIDRVIKSDFVSLEPSATSSIIEKAESIVDMSVEDTIQNFANKHMELTPDIVQRIKETAAGMLAVWLKRWGTGQAAQQLERITDVKYELANELVNYFSDEIQQLQTEVESNPDIVEPEGLGEPEGLEEPELAPDDVEGYSNTKREIAKKLTESLVSEEAPPPDRVEEIAREQEEDRRILAEPPPQMNKMQVLNAAQFILTQASQLLAKLDDLYRNGMATKNWKPFIDYVQQYFYVEVVEDAVGTMEAGSAPVFTFKMAADGSLVEQDLTLVLNKLPLPRPKGTSGPKDVSVRFPVMRK